MILPLAIDAMRTRFELVLVGPDSERLRAVGEEALEEIAWVEARFDRFSRSSVLTRVNREAAARAVRVDAESFELFALAARFWRETDGAFDPTVGPLMRALGLQGRCGLGGPVPSVEAALAGLGFGAVELDEQRATVRFARAGVALDFGGLAKGYALDRAAAVLREYGVEVAILHAGTSTTLALGAPPELAGWRIGLGDSSADDSDAKASAHGAGDVVELRDRGLSVSSARSTRGPRGDSIHVLDPSDGRPASGARFAALSAPLEASEAASEIGAATVCASRLDAWSTALIVRPALELPPPLRREGRAALPTDFHAEGVRERPLAHAPSPLPSRSRRNPLRR